MTDPALAKKAVLAGIHAVGCIHVPQSPRHVSLDLAAKIFSAVPDKAARVLVTMNAPPESVRSWVNQTGATAVQAHGTETTAMLTAYPRPWIKVVRSPEELPQEHLLHERMLMIDASSVGGMGGSGKTADWDWAGSLASQDLKVVLAGGLHAGNLVDAVTRVKPAAVDLNSGVETAPGVKDFRLIEQVIDLLDAMTPPSEDAWPW